jgi:hypothetical protein
MVMFFWLSIMPFAIKKIIKRNNSLAEIHDSEYNAQMFGQALPG